MIRASYHSNSGAAEQTEKTAISVCEQKHCQSWGMQRHSDKFKEEWQIQRV